MKTYWSVTEGAFNCLIDRPRTRAFHRAIKSVITPESIVLDLGSGTGIMSLFAARAGARKVYAVERDRKSAQWLAGIFESNGYGDIIHPIVADARQVVPPEKVNVIICEMVATGLIEELQVPVMNHALQFAERDCHVIPHVIDCLVEAVHVKDRFYGFRLPVPQYQYPGEDSAIVSSLTKRVIYQHVDFTKVNSQKVDVTLEFEIRANPKGRNINGIRLSNETTFPDGHTLGGTNAYCYPLILPVQPVSARGGDKILLSLSYTMCGGFRTLNYSLQKN